MTFDRHLFELFARWPDAAYLLCGDVPPAGLRFSAPVFKAVERRLDGLLEPADPAAPRRIVDVQFQRRADVYPRAGSYLAMLHQLDVERPVEAVILFARRDLDPRTPPWTAIIRAVYLDEMVARLRREDPRHPLAAAFAPVFDDDEGRLAREARTWYEAIHDSALAAPVQEACLTIFLSWLAERFIHLSPKDFAMLLDLPPITKTRVGRELMAAGRRKGHQVLVLKLTNHKFGALKAPVEKAIRALETEELEALGVSLLDMKSLKELRGWLDRH